MTLSIKEFNKNLNIITALAFIISFGLTYLLPVRLISPSWPFIIAFFYTVTKLIHYFLIKKAAGNHAKFINAFMLSTTVKLLLFLAIILIYVLLFREDAIGFILNFFVFYLIYTVFEIISILGVLKTPQNKD